MLNKVHVINLQIDGRANNNYQDNSEFGKVFQARSLGELSINRSWKETFGIRLKKEETRE